MDKVIVTKEETLVGKVIAIEGVKWEVIGMLSAPRVGGNWLMQALVSKELRLVPEWVIAHGRRLGGMGRSLHANGDGVIQLP